MWSCMSFLVYAGSTCESLLQILSVGLTKKGCFHNSHCQHSVFYKCTLMLVQGFVGGGVSAATRCRIWLQNILYVLHLRLWVQVLETSVEDSALSKFGADMVVLKAMIIVLQNSWLQNCANMVYKANTKLIAIGQHVICCGFVSVRGLNVATT